MAVVHISEEEAVSDLSVLLARVQDGTEFVIESEDGPVALLRPLDPDRKPVMLSELIRLAKEEDCQVLLDDQFSKNLEEIIRQHSQERLIDPWEST